MWLPPGRCALRGPHSRAAQPGAGPRTGGGDLGGINRGDAAGRPHARPAAQPPRRVRPGGLPASPAAGARGLASQMGVAGRGSMRRRRRDRRTDRRDHGCLAGLACRAAGGAADRVAASLPSLRQGQGVAAAGCAAAAHRRRAGGARARGLPGPARHHAPGMASQPGPPGGRRNWSVGRQVLAAWLAAAAAQEHLAVARAWRLDRHAAGAERGSGGRCRRPGQRHGHVGSPTPVHPWGSAARRPPVGPGDPGGGPAATR